MSAAVEQLGKVIRALRDGGWQGNAFDVGDALWLARQGILSGRPSATEIEQTSKPPTPPPPPPPLTKPPIDSEPKPPPTDRSGAGGSGDAGGGKSDLVKSGPEALLSIRQPARTDEAVRRGPGVSFLTPAARALPGGRELLRVLRPLRRRVPDPATWTLDEEATLERYCEQEAWIPVLRAGRRRWLDLALVLDAGPSMLPWRQTLREFRVLLERSGAFRDVRTWHLDTAGERPALRSRAGGRSHHPREVVEPSGQRLVLLVSDAVSPGWNDATLARWTELWGRRQLVALVQLFPEGFWDTTALADGRLCRVGATAPGQPNHRLRSRAWRGGAATDPECPTADVPVPVVSLTPGSLGPWAALVAGNSSVRPVAIRLGLGSALIPSEAVASAGAGAAPAATPRERIDWFEARATRTAMKLLSALAAAPLRLPVMRLVQEAAVPESQLTHLAEVFVSGLLRRVSPPGIADPDLIDFDFHDGVRDALLSRNRAVEVLRVQHLVSDYVQKRFGQRLNFQALLEAGGAADTEAVNLGPENGVFARVAADVLERLGSRYSSVVAQLRAPVQPTPPAPQPNPRPAPQPPGGTALAGKEVIYLGSSLEDFEKLKVAVERAGGTVFGVHRDPSQISNERLAAAAAWVVNFITSGAWDTAFRVIGRAHAEGIFRPFAVLSSDPRREAIATSMEEKGAVACSVDADVVIQKLEAAVTAPGAIDRSLLSKDRREAVLRHPDFPAVGDTVAGGLFGAQDSAAWAALEGHLVKRGVGARNVAAILAAATNADAVQYYRGGSEGSSWEFSIDQDGRSASGFGDGASVVLQWVVGAREPRLVSGSWPETTGSDTKPSSELYIPWLDSQRDDVRGVFYLLRSLPAGFHEPGIRWMRSYLRAADPAFREPSKDRHSNLSGRTLLWIDDRPERIQEHVQSLRALGAEVLVADDTITALQNLAEHSIDAVITDLRRGSEKTAGISLIERLRLEGADVPVAIHSTTRMTAARRREIIEAGALVCTDHFEGVQAALEVALRERPKATRPPLAAREREGASAKPGKKTESSPLSGRRILWVDDHPEKIEGLMQRLRDSGTDLVTCKTSGEALDHLMGGRFDGIISDIGRAEGRWAGFDLLDELRRLNNFVPVAFFTTVRQAASMAPIATRKGAAAISSKFDAIEGSLGRIGPGWSQSVAIGQFTREPLFLSPEHADAVRQRMLELGVDQKLVLMWVEGFREAEWSPLWNPSRTAQDPWVSLASLVRAATGYADVLVAEAQGGSLFDRAVPALTNERFAGPRAGQLRQRVFDSQTTRLIQDLSDPSVGEDAAGLTGARLLIPFHAGLIDIWTTEVHGFYSRQVRWLEMLAASFPQGGREPMAMA